MEEYKMTKYVIDASSLNDLQDRYPNDIPLFEPIYNKVYEMFENGELFSVREVYEELKDSQEFWEEYKYCFRALTENESKNVSEILCSEEFKVFVEKGLKDGGNWADPYLIACAMEDSEVVVITQESRTNKPVSRIPFVCSKLNIRSINLLEFIKEIND